MLSTKIVRVLVTDDSPTARMNLVQIINSEAGLKVVGEAVDGRQAVRLATTLRPDVILMDALMPEMDGLEATREIMSVLPTPIVVVSGTMGKGETDLSINAINSGALTAIRKPPGPRDPLYEEEARELISTVRAMADVRVIHHWKAGTPKVVPKSPQPLALPPLIADPKIVAIVASTGGPSALCEIVRKLPADFPLPVVIVQHISSDFIPSLVDWLDSTTPLSVSIAQHDDTPQPGNVYIAPGGVHLRITRKLRFDLSRVPDSMPHIPSGDIFLESVAEAYGPQAIGIVLTGMGQDGANGLRALFDSGSLTLAQDEATSVVYGMPRQAKEIGAARQVLSLYQIAGTLAESVSAGSH